MLQQLIASQVPASIRSRGQKYFQRGAVTILDGDASQIRALVQGGEEYEVLIRRRGKQLGAYCTCPYCDDRFDVCKHIWAVIVASDQGTYLNSVSARARIRIDSSLADSIEADLDDEHQLGYAEDDIEDEDLYEEDEPPPRWQPPPRASARPRQARPRRPSWRDQFAGLRQTFEQDSRAASDWPAGREIVYIVDARSTLSGKGLTIELGQRYRKKDGDWSKPKAESIGRATIAQLPDAADRHILSLLCELRAASDHYGYSTYNSYDGILRVSLPSTLFESMMPALCRTGRCLLRHSELQPELTKLDWCDGPPWQFKLEVNRESPKGGYVLSGAYFRGAERKHIAEPALLVAGGLIFWPDRVARLDDGKAFRWLSLLRREGFLTIPAKDASKLLAELLVMPALPPLTLPEELHYEEVSVAPRYQLQFKKPSGYWTNEVLIGVLSFAYEDQEVGEDSRVRGLFDAKQRRLLLRDRAAEQAAAARLAQLGMGTKASYGQVQRQLSPKKLPHVAATLLKEGWHVQAEGKLYRQASSFKIDVQSGIDWFDLHASADFDGQQVALPALLAALAKGENLVRLGDGSFGMLPDDWLKKMGFVGKLGAVDKDRVRFRKTQVGFLDALLAAQPEATCDAVFDRARQALQRFNGIAQADAPKSFTGALRSYQREGLGWIHFLDEFGFGGCLADDMGLGKTVQVLALLEERRGLRKKNKLPASLVVVPRSLVFNWKQEAERFTPQLRVLDHTGLARVRDAKAFDAHDLVVTTYGTLRRDAELLTGYNFDYCILDEAQAIKNTGTDTAKAARLLKGNRRLVLSGTPVENHLGELWSLFEFLNPGMLGHASVLQLTGSGRNIDPEARALLASALRPFLLRRTKEQVATDLPAKTEQTVFCDLDAGQRQHYDELRDFYRKSLLDSVERNGLGRAKIMVLEALLRLRQAACHPGLVDKKRVNDPATKLDLLLPRLREVTEEGHKALVFSQFTQFLSIIRKRLDDEGIVYEYLDGRTRDRAARVERFQNDPECRLFLISLKAGGLGLNLTAAEYVFLIDPWWNPAVEAQAVDRAHRIGQDKPVFAYRLIARDTVEEKVLELQKTKRALADAIINADNSLIRNLTKEDLQLLLS